MFSWRLINSLLVQNQFECADTESNRNLTQNMKTKTDIEFVSVGPCIIWNETYVVITNVRTSYHS